MDTEQNNTGNNKKAIRTIVDSTVMGCVDRANELRVTKDEYIDLVTIRPDLLVFLYYR